MLAQDALRLMGEALSAPPAPDDAVVAIAPMNWAAARQHLAVLRGPSYKKLTSQGEAKASEKSKIDIAQLVARSSADEARATISGLVIEEIARVLRLPREDIGRTTPLAEIGLDSLMAVELALGLEERFTLKAPLSTTASTFTVNELADHVIGLATGTMSDDDAVTRSMVERHLGSAGDAQTMTVANEIRKKGQEAKGILN
jgi:acyl carrier protein